jgi:hypothetical protein
MSMKERQREEERERDAEAREGGDEGGAKEREEWERGSERGENIASVQKREGQIKKIKHVPC